MSPVKSILGAKFAPSSSHNPLATNDLRKLRKSRVGILRQKIGMATSESFFRAHGICAPVRRINNSALMGTSAIAPPSPWHFTVARSGPVGETEHQEQQVEAEVPVASAANRIGGSEQFAKTRRMQINIPAPFEAAGIHDRFSARLTSVREVTPRTWSRASRSLLRQLGFSAPIALAAQSSQY